MVTLLELLLNCKRCGRECYIIYSDGLRLTVFPSEIILHFDHACYIPSNPICLPKYSVKILFGIWLPVAVSLLGLNIFSVICSQMS
jgi:hypothetical protein